ncbi:MAG: hypothetical protein D6758_05345 [Gammaproteobacteria bacterium]|nr:MAG: hypothetical protein D6758_05345 [Gammaproteobacteria bacterium]
MSDVIPARLLKGVELATVPQREFQELVPQVKAQTRGLLASLFRRSGVQPGEAKEPAAKRLTKTRVSFNGAAWLRFYKRPSQPIALYLVYRDDSGEHAVLVDETHVSETSNAMLSGNVSFTVKGHLYALRALAAGVQDASAFHIEEVYVQRKRQVASLAATRSA